jgi:hypothetical protein
MSTRYKGVGTLQLNCGIDLPRSLMTVAADAHHEDTNGGVRLKLMDSLPGGCSMQIVLTAEAAANLASELYTLARNAAAKGDATEEAEHRAPWVAMTA